MSFKSNIIRLTITILLLLGSIFLYLLIKFFYYQKQVQFEIKSYNQAVRLYNEKFLKLNSTKKIKSSKTNFYYINNSSKFVDELDLSYKDLTELIEQMKIKVVFETTNLKLRSQNHKQIIDSFSMDEKEIYIRDNNINKNLFYTTEDINNIYEEANKKQNAIINKAKKKR